MPPPPPFTMYVYIHPTLIGLLFYRLIFLHVPNRTGRWLFEAQRRRRRRLESLRAWEGGKWAHWAHSHSAWGQKRLPQLPRIWIPAAWGWESVAIVDCCDIMGTGTCVHMREGASSARYFTSTAPSIPHSLAPSLSKEVALLQQHPCNRPWCSYWSRHNGQEDLLHRRG